MAIGSTRLVEALMFGGFEIFRVDRNGTILERDGRAVVIPNGILARNVVDDLRRIAGITALQLDELLARRDAR